RRASRRRPRVPPGRLAPGEDLPPGLPVVALPALVHAIEVVVRDVDVYEVDARLLAFGSETEDQRRIRIALPERARAPGLHDQAPRARLQRPPAQRAAERAEARAGPGADLHFSSGDCAMTFRAQVHRIEIPRRRGKDHRLLDDLGHDVLAFYFG